MIGTRLSSGSRASCATASAYFFAPRRWRIFNSTLIYDVILIVVLGGIGLSGGRGGVINVVIGTLLIGTMLNGMTILDVSYSAQNMIKGLILLAAILVDSLLNPRNEETAQQGDI